MAADGLTFSTTACPETPDDGLVFGGYPQPPTVPPDPTGENWRGPPGPQGIPGIDGEDGVDGVDGVDGSPGISFLSGIGPPTGTQPVGTSYLDTVTGDVWKFT